MEVPENRKFAEFKAKLAKSLATRGVEVADMTEDEVQLMHNVTLSMMQVQNAAILGPVSLDVAEAKFRLAQFLLAYGDKEGAGRELIEGLAVQKQVEPDTLSYARNCMAVADIFATELSRHDEAAVLMNEAMEIHENTMDPTELSKLYFVVAQWELRKGEYDAAEISFERCCKNIVKMKETEEDTKLMLARQRCLIASLFHLRGEYDRTVEHYMKAIPVLETYAPEHELTPSAMLYHSVAQIHASMQGVENTETRKAAELDAIMMCQKSLNIMQVIKPGSMQEATICTVLAQLYHLQGLTTRALELRGRAVKIYDAVGVPHIDVKTAFMNVVLYKDLSATEDAEGTTVQVKHETANPQSVEEKTEEK